MRFLLLELRRQTLKLSASQRTAKGLQQPRMFVNIFIKLEFYL